VPLGNDAAMNAPAQAAPMASDASQAAGYELLDKLGLTQAQGTTPPNPYGSPGKPDHQQKVSELTEKARSEAGEGEQVLNNQKVRQIDSKRRPDVQIVNKEGKTRKVFEAERKPSSQRNIKRETEYKKHKLEQETHPVNPQNGNGNGPT
jgi:hypothetical protein